MSVQGGNAIDHAQAYAGMLADLELSNLVSKLNTGTVNIAFGVAVVTDGVQGAKLPGAGAAANTFIGIVHRDVNYVVPVSGVGQDNSKRDMSILTHGVVWARVDGTIAKDDPVYFMPDGLLTNADGGGTNILVEGAKFLQAAITSSTGNISKVSLGLGG